VLRRENVSLDPIPLGLATDIGPLAMRFIEPTNLIARVDGFGWSGSVAGTL
jgi:hypothetical protein